MEKDCVHEVHVKGTTLQPLSFERERHFKCSICFDVFWWDGPSILGPHDPHRKRSYSDKLFPLDDAAVMKLART